jgi:acyl carrier protein
MPAPPHDLTTMPTSAGTPAGDAILATVVKLLAEAIDEGDDVDLDFTRETSLGDDIEIESIELVALGELLLETYGERVDLIAWIGDLNVDQITGLTVGQLVDFIAAALRGDID